jgi:hypothetical protein
MISLTAQLTQASQLLELDPQSLAACTVAELKAYAKALNIRGAWKMNKQALLDAITAELDNLRGMMEAATEQAAKSSQALKALKAEGGSLPIHEVATKAYKRLREIVKSSQSFESLKEAAQSLAATVARVEMREHEISTAIKTRRPQIKRAMIDHAHSEGMMQTDMVDAVDVFYAALCAYQRQDSLTLNREYKQAVQAKNEGKKAIAIAPTVAKYRDILEAMAAGGDVHWCDLSIALALGSGRRMAEIHSLGSFEVVGEYAIHFSGQAKTRDADGSKDDYEIPTLYPARLLKMAHDRLIAIGRTLPRSAQLDNPRAVNKTYNMALSRRLAQAPYTYKEFRAIYAELMWAKNGTSNREKHTYYSEILGHNNMHGASNSTYTSYMIFDIIDAEEALEI